MPRRITAVVVSYNRKQLLQRCLDALSSQTRRPDHIVVVDNASTDGTLEMLRVAGWLDRKDFELLAQAHNAGGAGGFAAGMTHAAASHTGWIWVMDDDCLPDRDALRHLDDIQLDPGNLYGSAAVCGELLSWPMRHITGSHGDMIRSTSDLPSLAPVHFIPFVGLLVSRAMVRRIGVPDAGLFIAADDVDYCFRARAAGAQLILVGQSRIEHPASERYRLWLPWRTFDTLSLAPWKRYYDVRNRILVARRHYGLATYYKTIPGLLLQLLATLIQQQDRVKQATAFAAGMIDGLRGKKGRRHELWGIRS